MSDIRLICHRDDCNGMCDVKYKVIRCTKKNKYHIYQLGKHNSESEQSASTTTASNRDIRNYVKDMIKNCIYDKDIIMPKKIEIRLRSKTNLQKFHNDADIPSLIKIRNYVRYLREKLGNNNKISDVKKSSELHQYSEELDENEFFVFGEDFGSGTDDDHFQIGFTSKTLFKRVNKGVVFHYDSSYKIIRF